MVRRLIRRPTLVQWVSGVDRAPADNPVGRNPTRSASGAIALIQKDRFSKQFGRAVEMKLFFDPRAIRLHRLHAHVEFLGRPSRFKSAPQHAKDLEFAIAETLGGRWSPPAQASPGTCASSPKPKDR